MTGNPRRPPVDFDDLFRRLYPRLHRYCFRLTGDADAAEDVAQEAFVRMLRRDVSGDEEGIRVWLFRVALNLVRDRGRVRSNRERLLRVNPVRPSPPEPADRRVERKERIAAVREALDEIPARDREILLLREEGFAYREIAEAVGVAPTSVGTLLARARERFCEAFEEG